MNNAHLHIIGSKPFYNLLNELDLNYTFSTDDNSKYNEQNKFGIHLGSYWKIKL
jgi:hypothetical protein